METKSKLCLYLADLTHTYIALANGSFPLGIGYVASALKTIFEDEIELELFKYPDNLEEALKKSPPDVYFFSNYMWNQNINLFYAQKIKELYPDTLTIAGGPNFSNDRDDRKIFLEDHPYLDFFIVGEGEIPSCNIIQNYINVGKNIKKLKEIDLVSTITLLPDGTMKEGADAPRIGSKRLPKETYTGQWSILDDRFTALGDVPSPYVSGVMDKFFDNHLYPIFETNRGCPFKCTFCQRGGDYFNRTIFRPLDMVKEELDYITHHIVSDSPGVGRLECADSNFAMFQQDLEICKHLRGLQDKHSYPHYLNATTGKNKPELIIEATSKLKPNSIVISNSIQSKNTDTLEAIKRSNISLEKYSMVQDEVQRRGLRSKADLILGLPLETKQSHFKAVYELIDSGVQEFASCQAMILKDTDLEFKDNVTKYGFKSKWRLLPRALGEYEGIKGPVIIPEVEQIIVATDTLLFEDYIDARRLHLVDFIFHNSGLFDLIYSYLEEHNIRPAKFIEQIYFNCTKTDFPLKDVFDEFTKETKGELFDSEKSCIAFYNNPTSLNKVKNGEMGGNLLFQYLSVALFEEWVSTVKAALMALEKLSPDCHDDLKDLREILNARVVDVRETPLKKNVLMDLHSDKVVELINKVGYDLEQNAAGHSSLKMQLSDSQYEVLLHAKTVYPENRAGRSLILSMYRVHAIMREPVENQVVSVCP